MSRQPLQIETELKKVYDSIADQFSSTRNFNWPEFELIEPYLNGTPRILDLGCGNGRLINFLDLKLKKYTYHGLDFSEQLIKHAKCSFPDHHFKVGDQKHLPFADQEFDLVFSVAAFHHLASKKHRLQTLREIKRTLNPNGILFLTVWNLWQPRYKKEALKAIFKGITTFSPINEFFIPWGNSKIPRFYHAFFQTELKNLLRQSGFDILKFDVGNNFTAICKPLPKLHE